MPATRESPATAACSRCSVKRSCGTGVGRYVDAVNDIGCRGSGYMHGPSNGVPNPTSCIRILRNAGALSPEAGARCGSAARRDLCGGCWVTGIPTATAYGVEEKTKEIV
jgi:hypothetical protein